MTRFDKLLSNEKYIGDSLCQKTYTTNVFPYIRKDNKGQADQYYTENSHPAIIDREVFDRVQSLMRRRAERVKIPHSEYVLSQKMVCGTCGTVFVRRSGKSGFVTWGCRKYDRKASSCPIGRIPEAEIYAAFVRMYNKLKQNEGVVLKPVLRQLEDLNTALQRDNPAMLAINQAIAQAAEQSHKISVLQTRCLRYQAAGPQRPDDTASAGTSPSDEKRGHRGNCQYHPAYSGYHPLRTGANSAV